MLTELAGWSAKCALLPAAACLAAWALAAAFQVRVPLGFLPAAGACWLVSGIILFIRNFPGLKETAARCDRLLDGKDQIATALFLLENNIRGAFADHTMEWAVRRLQSPGHIRRYFPERRDYGAWSLFCVLAAGAIFFLPQLAEESAFEFVPESNPSRQETGISMKTPQNSSPPRETSANPGGKLSSASGSGSGRDKIGRMQLAVFSPGSGRGDSPETSPGSGSGSSPRTDRKDAEKNAGTAAVLPAENQPRKSVFNADDEGSTGIGGMLNAEADENSLRSGGGDNLDMTRDTEEETKNRTPRQNARGGLRPLTRDNAPPAGREQSDRDGKGDKPGEGRGGPSGHKKSRGIASWLPVIPVPDQVAGRLNPGHDIESREKSTAKDAEDGNVLEIQARTAKESLAGTPDAGRGLRLELAKYFLRLHEKDQ